MRCNITDDVTKFQPPGCSCRLTRVVTKGLMSSGRHVVSSLLKLQIRRMFLLPNRLDAVSFELYHVDEIVSFVIKRDEIRTVAVIVLGVVGSGLYISVMLLRVLKIL